MNRRRVSSSGEIAALLTIISMIVIGLGISFGSQVRQPQSTQTEAAVFDIRRIFRGSSPIFPQTTVAPIASPTPTPIFHEGNTQWFSGQAQQCIGWFDCTYDPHVLKIELRSTVSNDVMKLDKDVTGRTPVGRNIGASCANRVKGFQVEFDPAHTYTNAQIANIRNATGATIQPGQILLSMKPNSTDIFYYIYDRPQWALGAADVELYFEYDVNNDPDIVEAHAQSVNVPGGCVEVTPTPTSSDDPTPTPTGSDDPDPSITPVTQLTPSITPGGQPTPTGTSRPTPSITITPVPSTQACLFKSLAFVQECTEWADKDRGICAKDNRGFNVGKPVVEARYALSDQVPGHNLDSALWNIRNNKNQTSAISFNPSYRDQFGRFFTGAYVNVPSFDPAPWRNLEADITINIDPSRYQFLPKDGKEIRRSSPVSANMDRFRSQSNIPQTIHGLKISCNQDIEYGWTLQRCENSFDYVFVLDTSSSMYKFNDPYFGKRKIDVMKDNMEVVLNQIGTDAQSSGNRSRVALIQFNKTPLVLRDFSTDYADLIKVATTGLQLAEGTNIEGALSQAHSLLQARPDKSRTPVVIFLTDGLPNSNPGNPPPAAGYEPLIYRQVDNLKLIEGITIVAIGYGNPKLAGSDIDQLPGAQLFDIIKRIATDETWAFSTDTTLASASGNINEIYSRITSRLNSCAKTNEFIAQIQKSADINGDGFVNTTDLSRIFEAYFLQTVDDPDGDLPEDINNDGVVNAIDASTVIENLGVNL